MSREHSAEKDAGREPCRTNPHKAHGDCPGSTRAQHGAALLGQLQAIEASRNGRPLASHERHLDSDFARENHDEHVRLHGALCVGCGCCWCCDDDCCAEYTCPNKDCGCSDKPAPTYVIPPAERGQNDA